MMAAVTTYEIRVRKNGHIEPCVEAADTLDEAMQAAQRKALAYSLENIVSFPNWEQDFIHDYPGDVVALCHVERTVH